MTQEIPVWLGILLFFLGAMVGLIVTCSCVVGGRYDDCYLCRYLLFFEKVTRNGQCSDCSKLWMSDLAKGPSAKKGA